MIHDIIVWLFGVAAFGAACNLPAWTHLLFEGWSVHIIPWWRDNRLLMRIGMVLTSMAIGAASWLRAASFMEYPQTQPQQVLSLFGYFPVGLPTWGPIVWIVPMAIAEIVFLAMAKNNANDVGRVSWAWNSFIAIMVVWAPFVAIMHP